MKKGILVIIALIMFSMFLFGKSVGKSKSMRPVDMGLSVKWATCNIGASSNNMSGTHFAWSEIVYKGKYNWSNLKYVKKIIFGYMDFNRTFAVY